MTTPAPTLNQRLRESDELPSSEQVWQQFHQALFSFIRARVSDRGEAEDLLMDVFIRVQRGLPDLADTSSIAGWIFRIARNLVIDHYRRQRSDTTLSEHVDSLQSPEKVDDEAEQQLARCVGSMIQILPEATREILQWVDMEGLSQQAAAKKLGLSPSGARSKVQRGRAQLKNMVLACCSIERDRLGNVVEHSCNSGSGCC